MTPVHNVHTISVYTLLLSNAKMLKYPLNIKNNLFFYIINLRHLFCNAAGIRQSSIILILEYLMMNVHTRLNQIALLQLCFLAHILSVQNSAAQGQILISKNASFSSQDVRFERNDVLFLKIISPQIDYSDLDRNEFRLEPQSNSATLENTLINHMDGSYSIAVPLDLLDPSEDDWIIRVRLEDENGLEFRTSIEIDIGEDLDDDVDREMDHLRVTGTIEEKTDSTITVAGLVFIVDPSISAQDDQKEDITYASLLVGQRIVIEGISFLDDNFALDIYQEELRENEILITGKGESLSTNTVTVAGVTLDVNNETQVYDTNNFPIQFTDLTVGLMLEVSADFNDMDQLIATRIKVERHIDDEIKLHGNVEEVTKSAMTVLGQQLTITPNTLLLGRDNLRINIAAFSAGTLVSVDADLQPDGQRIALQIKQETEDTSQIRVNGVADSVASDMLVVAGVQLILDNNAVILDTHGDPLSQEALDIGQSLEVKAELQSDNIPVVKEIRLRVVTSIAGTISNMSDNGFAIGPFNVIAGDKAIFLNQNNQPVAASSIGTSSIAKARVVLQDNNFTASKIKVLQNVSNTVTSWEQIDLPKGFELLANYPNPFNPTTTISFNIKQHADMPVSLIIYNTLGRKVRTLIHEAMNAGHYSVEWNARDEVDQPVASGIYLYRLQVGDLQISRSMTLIK